MRRRWRRRFVDADDANGADRSSQQRLLGADDGAIGLYESRRHVVQIEATYRLPETELGAEFEPNEGLVGRVLATGAPVILDNYGELDRITLPEQTGNAVIGVPIPGPSGGLLGVFGIGARPPRRMT